MSYLNENGLARYDGLLKNWVTFKSGTVDGIDPLLNWQKTETADAVTCYPIPASPLEPNVSFMFTETPPSSGDKSPSNPSTITGVNSVKVTRCGKNLISLRSGLSTQVINDVTFTVNGDGTYTVNGTASGNAYFYIRLTSNGIRIAKGITYTLSGCPSGGGSSSYRLFMGEYQGDSGNGKTFTLENDTVLNCFITISSGYTANNIVFKPQLELGSTATSFEPYSGTDYTISLNGTFYGGSLDVATGVMTVTWVGVVYNGTEDITKKDDLQDGTPQYNLPAPSYAATGGELRVVSTHFPFGYTANCGYVRTSAGTGYRVYPVGYDTLESFTAWVASQYAAGTPLTVAYKTASPITVQLTPTQIYSLSQLDPYTPRINTVYSDQQSVQVGYPKSPIATSTELTNAIVSLGGNI